MSKTFEEGKQEVARLCEYFATNREKFRAPGVKEAHIRQTLIDPFFEALGWDFRNTAGLSQNEREVEVERGDNTTGRPDYNFRINGRTVYYAEAKAPHIQIERADVIMQTCTSKSKAQPAKRRGRVSSARSTSPMSKSLRWCMSCMV